MKCILQRPAALRWLTLTALSVASITAVETENPWKVDKGFNLTSGDPATLFEPGDGRPKGDAIVGEDGTVSFRFGRGGAGSGGKLAWAAGTVGDAQVATVKLLNWTSTPEVPAGWTALLISLRNDLGKSINLNLGGASKGFISVNEPAWRSVGGAFTYTTPATFALSRSKGDVLLIVDGREIKRLKDDAEHPYQTLVLSASIQNLSDSVCVSFSRVEIGAVPASVTK